MISAGRGSNDEDGIVKGVGQSKVAETVRALKFECPRLVRSLNKSAKHAWYERSEKRDAPAHGK